MPELVSVRELSSWLSKPSVDTFPYDPVVSDYLHVGKHFVARELLAALDGVRSRLVAVPGTGAGRSLLAGFLDVALDKWDGRYDYGTYLALPLLPLPGTGGPATLVRAQHQHDRLFASLTADVVRFELDALDGSPEPLPQMRPDAPTVAKRVRLGSRAVQPALCRLGLAGTAQPAEGDFREPFGAARDMCAAVAAQLSPAERGLLRLSLLPVWVAHDEYMFVRVLQAFETTFAQLVVLMRTGIEALSQDGADIAVSALDEANRSLGEAARVFSLMATMQVDSFRTFRQYTEGASAIQSQNYKILESLCMRPSASRLDSPAYLSVPDVRDGVLTGHATLDGEAVAALRRGRASPPARAALSAAMLRFEATMQRWRRTHYRLATRMLGDLSGTGYTEGTPYLKDVQTLRVFSVPPADVPPADAPAAGDLATMAAPPSKDVSAMTYSELIRTEDLRIMQREIPSTGDGLFFVAAHQVTELWFTIILHELSRARDAMDNDDLAAACCRPRRVRCGEDVLVCHLRAVETISPADFATIRSHLGTSSAFESVQFREIEFLSGLKDPRYLASGKLTPPQRQRLAVRLAQPSLADAFGTLHARRGRPDLAAVVHRGGDPALGALVDALMDHDHGFARWRHAHALLAESLIGGSRGTGGSMGAAYLQATTAKRFFPKLWEVRSAT